MGEVRVKVKLTNARDRYFANEREMPPQSIRTVEADAIVDTGAVRCVLPQSVVDLLGLRVSRQASGQFANGTQESVGVSSTFEIDLMGRIEEETALIMGSEILVGQTALEKMDFLVDCPRQRLIPNPAHPNGPANRV